MGGDYDVLIVIETLQTEGVWPKGLKNEVLSWIEKNKASLLEEWNRWHK
ncbi:hypothetical protein [Desulfonatronospira sp. MSAO_Bac3]